MTFTPVDNGSWCFDALLRYNGANFAASGVIFNEMGRFTFMKQVLVLGAGMVSRPLVRYLLDHQFKVRLGDIRKEQAVAIIDGHPNGESLELDIANRDRVRDLVRDADLVISLLPPSFHLQVAELCLAEGRHFLTASYLSPEMEAMNDAVAAKDLVFLNEVGLDPGLDHLTAMEIIDHLKESGYEIESFHSHCGGIPSRKAATNALRYKLSWSPAGVLRALTRPSRFRSGGELREVPGENKLAFAEVIHIPEAGVFESSPNADSLFYGKRYGLNEVRDIRRGTLRYPGWAPFWLFVLELGWLDPDQSMRFDNEPVLSALFKVTGKQPPRDFVAFVREKDPGHASKFLEMFDNLGLLNKNLRISGDYSAFRILLERVEAELRYELGELDLVVLHHEFIASKDGKRERWTSSLAREGTQDGVSAMAFLVGIPAAIAARLILEDRISQRGVMIPLTKEYYQPILKELSDLGLPHEVEQTPLDDSQEG